MCVFIIREIPRATNSLLALCLKLGKQGAIGQGKGNGGASRKLVIIGMSFF